MHDHTLLEALETLPQVRYSEDVFRTIRKSLDPLAASTRGGRWSLPNDVATLYTSCTREGSIAEAAYHLSQLDPLPSQPMVVHRLTARTARTLKLIRADFSKVGIDPSAFGTLRYKRTQAVGAAVAFLGCDGLIAPSARWDCDNLMIFESEGHSTQELLTAHPGEEVDWLEFAREHGMLGERGE